MAPKRKPVVDPGTIVDDWHLRPRRGQSGRGRVSHASKTSTERREPPRPLQEVPRTFPRLALVYEARPAYSLEDPPEDAKL